MGGCKRLLYLIGHKLGAVNYEGITRRQVHVCAFAHTNLLLHSTCRAGLKTLNKRLVVDLLLVSPLTQWLGQQVHLLHVILVPSHQRNAG